jgi:hypothetical protein
VRADVALAKGPEQGVGDGVDEGIPVGVAEKPGGRGDVDAAEDEPRPVSSLWMS